MDCVEYRKSILADPGHPSAEMLSHVAICNDCTEYTERLLRFENRLERALRVRVEEVQGGFAAAAGSIFPLRPGSRTTKPLRARRHWVAMAASVLAVAVVFGSLWLALPRDSLADDVVGHMAEEPNAWSRTDVPVPEPKLDQVLSASHVELKSSAGLVTYANSCLFRGYTVPHLVVQTEAGPVTVMVLPHESVRHSKEFNEQGYRGVIVPVPGHGSLAVLERGPAMGMKAVKNVATRVLGAIDWTG